MHPVSGIRYRYPDRHPVWSSSVRYPLQASGMGIRYPVSGMGHPVSGIRYGIRYQVFGIRYPASCTGMVIGTWHSYASGMEWGMYQVWDVSGMEQEYPVWNRNQEWEYTRSNGNFRPVLNAWTVSYMGPLLFFHFICVHFIFASP